MSALVRKRATPKRRTSRDIEFTVALLSGRTGPGGRITSKPSSGKASLSFIHPYGCMCGCPAGGSKALARHMSQPEAEPKTSACTQEMGCQCGGCKQGSAAIQAAKTRDKALVTSFRASLGELPGQDDFGGGNYTDTETGWIYFQNGDDLLVCKPVTSVRQLEGKLKAEQDAHPKSQDWLEAPAGTRELYAELASATADLLRSGAGQARVAVAADRFQAQLEWLTRGNGAPLLVLEGGRFARLLCDPKSTRERPRYPGCPEEVNPKAGRTFNGLLDTIVQWIRSTGWGCKLTNRDMCRTINSQEFRDLYDLHEYRYVSETAMSAVVVKLRRSGVVPLVKSAVKFRQGHQWHLESPAVYRTSLRLMPEQEAAITACIVAALKPKPEEIRESLRRTA